MADKEEKKDPPVFSTGGIVAGFKSMVGGALTYSAISEAFKVPEHMFTPAPRPKVCLRAVLGLGPEHGHTIEFEEPYFPDRYYVAQPVEDHDRYVMHYPPSEYPDLQRISIYRLERRWRLLDDGRGYPRFLDYRVVGDRVDEVALYLYQGTT